MPNGLGPNHLLIRPKQNQSYLIHLFKATMFCYEYKDISQPLFELSREQCKAVFSFLCYWMGPRYVPLQNMWHEDDFKPGDSEGVAGIMHQLIEKYPPEKHGGFPIFMNLKPSGDTDYVVGFFSTKMTVYKSKKELFELNEEEVEVIFNFLEYWAVDWFQYSAKNVIYSL